MSPDQDVYDYKIALLLHSIEVHTPGAKNTLTPTVLIELYFTYDPKSQRDIIAQELKTNLGPTVLKNVKGGTS